jgi:CheY-like chemotaxis protein
MPGGEVKQKQRSILVVEDEDDVRELVTNSLRGHGFAVLSVPNGEVALQILSEQVVFDLMFTDIVMPGTLDGFELAEKAIAMLPQLKILYATGYTHASQPHGRPLHGKLIQKPYRTDDLAQEIARALQAAPS